MSLLVKLHGQLVQRRVTQAFEFEHVFFWLSVACPSFFSVMGLGLSRCLGTSTSSVSDAPIESRFTANVLLCDAPSPSDDYVLSHRTFQRGPIVLRVFVAWRRVAFRTKLDRVQVAMLHQDEALARMTARMEEVEATAMRALWNLHKHESGKQMESGSGQRGGSAPSASRSCMACAQDIQDISKGFSECTNGHAFCTLCVDSLAKMLMERMTAIPERCLCMAIGQNCTGIIRDSDLAKTENGRRLLCEAAHAKTVTRLLKLVEDRQHSADLCNVLTMHFQRMRHDGSYRAYQCPTCHFGPIDHAHCDNLVEHHDQEGVNNACPRCGLFVSDVNQLVAWRG